MNRGVPPLCRVVPGSRAHLQEVTVRKTVFVLLLVGLFGVAMMPGSASSHREAPLISKDPGADNTDVYASSARTAGEPSR